MEDFKWHHHPKKRRIDPGEVLAVLTLLALVALGVLLYLGRLA